MEKITLIDKVKLILEDISDGGWRDLLLQHGFDITATDFRSELLKPLAIDRTQPGFEDFALNGLQAIEPCKPSQSLLFHALASPQVVSWKEGNCNIQMLTKFPSFEEICVVENLVYGIKPPTIHELRVKANKNPMAVVVFSSEYRTAINTVHQRHADKCFSRVGNARIGTEKELYNFDARGYLPFADDVHKIRVTPCYYSAYISIKLNGDKDNFGPLRFQEGEEFLKDVEGVTQLVKKKSDKERDFWVPLHKLFEGDECVNNINLTLTMEAGHVNEKLRRVHRALSGGGGHQDGYNTGHYEPAISKPPFIFNNDIASLQTFAGKGEGNLTPVVHHKIIESTKSDNGKFITYTVPASKKPFRSSVNIVAKSNGARKAPEYVHARHKIVNEQIIDLNDDEKMLEKITEGNYEALHYVDYTGDGYVEVTCPELVLEYPDFYPAYSMVSAIDFFPLVKQYDLINWWNQSVPAEYSGSIWPSNPGPPLSLCDIRYPGNLSLTYKKFGKVNRPDNKQLFNKNDDTIAAIVGLYKSYDDQLTIINPPVNYRVSCLPDGASGVFAPGWDSSIDRTEEYDANDDGVVMSPGQTYFNNYGLGSPFPEDAMLCAALSSFWPAAAPDITRSFAPGNYATTTPLTDDLIGMENDEPWNNIPAPKIVDQRLNIVAYHKIEYGDFVQTALDDKFDYSKITLITEQEYAARTLIMCLVYGHLGAKITAEKRQWAVLSFKKIDNMQAISEPEVREAINTGAVSLNFSCLYKFEIFNHRTLSVADLKEFCPDLVPNYKKAYVKLNNQNTIYADPKNIVIKTLENENAKWEICRY